MKADSIFRTVCIFIMGGFAWNAPALVSLFGSDPGAVSPASPEGALAASTMTSMLFFVHWSAPALFAGGILNAALAAVQDGGWSDASASVRVQVQPPRPLADAAELPRDAQAIVASIRSMLAEVRALPRDETSEVDYTQRQMDTAYLPSVISAYLIIPESRRAKHTPALLGQLETLRQATESILDRAAEESATDLEVSGRFLEEKFGRPVDALRSLRGGTADQAKAALEPAL